MKLLTKTSLYFFSAMVLLLVVTGLYLFRQFTRQLNARSDQELLADEYQWVDYLESNIQNSTAFILHTRDLDIYPVNAQPAQYPKMEDTSAKSSVTGSTIPFRQLSQVVSIGGIPYQLIIRKSQEQKAAFVAGFTRIMLVVFAGLFLISLLFNWIISNALWSPFRQSLQKIKTAELQKMKAMHFEKTTTTEFNELNAALNYMTGRIYSDYVNMKEFTENAAHEMQTPIAVIQSKLELLLQDSSLGEQRSRLLTEAADATGKLGKLNQGLLFLARIENNQFIPTQPVHFAAIIQKYLLFFNELIIDKQLAVETDLQEDFTVLLHPLLAESIVTNLIGNAIKYNFTGGTIKILTREDLLQVTNSSNQPAIPTNKLFKRFAADEQNTSSSNGLGLAIVKKIAATNQLELEYHFENALHRFVVKKAAM